MACLDVKNMDFKQVGENVRIYPGAKIIGCEHIYIGSNVIIDDFAFIYATAPVYIGSYVHISSYASVLGGGVAVLEDFCNLSPGARVFSGSDDFSGAGLTNSTIPGEFRQVSRTFVHIGKFCMLGANSVVLPGVIVGEGSVVGAGGVVTGSIGSWGIHVGAPVRRVRERDSSTILRQEKELMAKYPYEPFVPPLLP